MKDSATNTIQFLTGGGEMGALIRAKDWSKTPVGKPEKWSQSLHISLNIILQSRFPMFLFWGPELICFYNDAYRPSLGENGKHPSILGMKAKDAWPEIWDIIKPLIDSVMEAGESTWSEDQLIPIYRNGKIEDVYWTFSYSAVKDEFGKTVGVFITCVETTDKIKNFTANKISLIQIEESEIRFRKMVETIPEIAWAASPDGPYSFYNKRFYDYTGLSVEESHKDWKWESIVHPDMFELRNKTWEHSLSTGEDFYFETLLKRNSDQAYRWHISRAAAIKNEKGEIALWVGTSTDIHEQKVFSQELEKQVKERTKALIESVIHLQQTNENLEQFASIASHDLQEPLRKIQTFTALLEKRFKNDIPEGAKILIDKIKNSSERMSVLIRDVLNFSRITQYDKEYENVDMNEIYNNVIKDFELLIQEKKVEISKGNLPKIEGIAVQINQMIYNLISNSIKFCKDDFPCIITISSRRLSTEELKKYDNLKPSLSYYEIVFKDNGIGFDSQFAEEIFLIFHRLHDSKQYSGTGIGLALCKRIVDNHHGKIYAESNENGGAEFYIILPTKQKYFL